MFRSERSTFPAFPLRAPSESAAHGDVLPDLGGAAFVDRHIGPRGAELESMLRQVGCASLDDLSAAVVPPAIRTAKPLSLPPSCSEHEALAEIRGLAQQNQVFRSFIGMGYYDCLTPPVIQRNILENPGWYTQYTPYQAEISQGRLEGLLNFQTMVADLTALDVANASLLDEATAAAEAMTMSHRLKDGRNVFFVSETCHPQTVEVVAARAKALGIEIVVGNAATFAFDERVSGALVQYPDTFGAIHDYAPFVEKAHAAGALVAVATDLLALTLIRPPGEFGADIAVGSAQRFGVPLGYGGPHAAFFATRDAYKRGMPGRLVGVSKDARGKPALRLSLQTREQHIRRDKATSNICTAQALLANVAMAYAVYHGPQGLRSIAKRVHTLTSILAAGLERLGHPLFSKEFFDTITVHAYGDSIVVKEAALKRGINLRADDQRFLHMSLDETTTAEDIEHILTSVVDAYPNLGPAPSIAELSTIRQPPIANRQSSFLTQPVFNRHHSETEMLRYLKRLESRDLSLTASMIPLGSCTMKLNATAEMLPISWPEFARIHPFAPREQAAGYAKLFAQLENWLAEITGFAAVSLQPNAGSQGEYAGLLVIRAHHVSRGQSARQVCLIPTSAHGTNPASAVMAGFRVVPVACDAEGNVDLNDLRAKAASHAAELGALMVTYPSTHGVFETGIREICDIVHAHGGQVYMDGANLNAQVGLCRPGELGADVGHLNLHKTFCIPHGGGGPGVGPIAVAAHLKRFLPGHGTAALGDSDSIRAVAAAPWGSASILPISWMYIRMMGADGLRRATQAAILNANYIARRLAAHFPVLYRGPGGWVAHECILDLRQFKSTTAEDVAKRLMDFGFHAPTLSWPVAGTLMVEPTESEPKPELDRFCEAMIAIHAEMQAVESGQSDRLNNPLKQAPHTADVVTADQWHRPYSREQAAFPVASLREFKFWPAVGRIDNVHGDRNLVCTCAGMENYA